VPVSVLNFPAFRFRYHVPVSVNLNRTAGHQAVYDGNSIYIALCINPVDRHRWLDARVNSRLPVRVDVLFVVLLLLCWWRRYGDN